MYRFVTQYCIFLISALVAVSVMVGPAAAGKPSAGTLDANGPKAVFPKLKYEFGSVMEGDKIKYDFIVENHGDAPLVIKNIRPD